MHKNTTHILKTNRKEKQIKQQWDKTNLNKNKFVVNIKHEPEMLTIA